MENIILENIFQHMNIIEWFVKFAVSLGDPLGL